MNFAILAILVACTYATFAEEVKSKEGPIFERRIYIGVPAEKVWDALTNPATASKYFLVPLQKLELKSGGQVVYGRDKAMIEGKVVEVVQGSKLVHTFSFAPEGHPGSEADPPSRVSYFIQPMGDMCVLELRHDRFPSENQTFHNISGGWDVMLSAMKTLLETGKLLPWPKPTPK